MSEYYKEVEAYFNNKSEQYDDVDKQLYWVLSDEFFKKVLQKEIPQIFQKNDLRILDAGAGTGRWTLFFYEMFSDKYNIEGRLVDISKGMLKVAKEKIDKRGLDSIFDVSVGNIEDMLDIKDGWYDLSLSFYNVLSFAQNPDKALVEIYKKLNDGGVHISILVNKYHAYYFSVLTNRLSELDRINDESKIKFNDDMPAIHCVTPIEAEELYKKAGFENIKVIGGPNFIYPGMEETRVYGSTEVIQNKLQDESIYKKILETEIANYDNGDIAGRSNALMVIAKK